MCKHKRNGDCWECLAEEHRLTGAWPWDITPEEELQALETYPSEIGLSAVPDEVWPSLRGDEVQAVVAQEFVAVR